MKQAQPLPGYLVRRYHGWKATDYHDNKSWYRRLSAEGQHPRAMVISCCDSRVHVTSVFRADQGEFFVHRNIANLVPPHAPDAECHGTAAAVEYAVCALKVAHLIVLGHSGCGGVSGCHDMCMGRAPELEAPSSFVGRWIGILRPGFERVKHISDDAERRRALEKEAVLQSLHNLMTFPFVAGAVAQGDLSLHGLWYDIGEGVLEAYDADTGGYMPV